MLLCTLVLICLYHTTDTVGYMHDVGQLKICMGHGSNFALGAGYKRGYVLQKRNARHRTKVLKVTLPLLNSALDAKLAEGNRLLTRRQKVNFGYRMAQKLGDGGNISCYNESEDKEASVTNYFTAHLATTRRPKFNKQLLKQVAENPNKSAGEFTDKPAICHKCFYKPKFQFFDESEYARAARGTSAIRALYHSLDKKQREIRGYHGLSTEVIFTRIPREELDILRQTEVDSKRASLSPKTPIFLRRRKKDEKAPNIQTIAQNLVKSAQAVEQE